jgi:hypothetical protein
MDKEIQSIDIVSSILLVTMMVLIIFFTALISNEAGYKHGQIDAINGKIKYEKQIKEVEQWIPLKENK